jgi:aryl-alcohol dehydrogenase-like predicted oxidoreductase
MTTPERRAETTIEPARTAGGAMRYGEIARVGKPVSRLVAGILDQTSNERIEGLLEEFFELGGNALDTAWLYRDGAHERFLGRWLERRGIRDDAVVVTKGAHTPHCTPAALTSQLFESLERLRTDYVDLYFLHRDNESVPVGEFVSVLNEHQAAGRIRSFGFSNWTLERVDAANAYAERNRLNGAAAVSSQLSLARMVKPLFPGCVSAGDPGSRARLEAQQLPLLAFSSQARGFFARADRRLVERLRLARFGRVLARRAGLFRGDWDRDELVRCWYSPDNFRRLERAQQLATEHGVQATTIALAYVLAQPFPTFALVGPADSAELRTSIEALHVELTDDELHWLDLRRPSR